MSFLNGLVILLFCFNVLASNSEQTAEFRGVGLIKAQPEYVEINFGVHSECYENPSSAQIATDEIVKKIDDYVQTLKNEDDTNFKIIINGGFTAPFSKWHDNREICRNTFQKVSDVTLRISMGSDFDKLFAGMQNYVLKNFEGGNDFFETARTFVQVSQPSPHLTDETRVALEKKALHLAMLDAKSRFKAAMQSCQQHAWKISNVREYAQESNIPQPRAYFAQAKFSSAAHSESGGAPVKFDDMSIEKQLFVTFQFEGALCYEP